MPPAIDEDLALAGRKAELQLSLAVAQLKLMQRVAEMKSLPLPPQTNPPQVNLFPIAPKFSR